MKRTCAVCGKEYECYDKPRGNKNKRFGKYLRGYKTVTCSPECSAKHATQSRLG